MHLLVKRQSVRILSAVVSIAVASTAAGAFHSASPKAERTRGAWLLWHEGSPAVELAVPKGYEVESQMGPDFTVHRVYRESAAPSDLPGILLYVGNYPSAFEPREHPESVTQFNEPALGKQITWRCWVRLSSEPPRVCETFIFDLIPEPDRQVNKTVLHILVTGSTAEEIREWRGVATLSIVCIRCTAPE